MNIEVGEIIELENNKEFICFSKKEHEGNTYIYLMSNFKPLEIRFAKLLNNPEELELEIINNQEEKEKVLNLFK